jgi:hypothetical protein
VEELELLALVSWRIGQAGAKWGDLDAAGASSRRDPLIAISPAPPTFIAIREKEGICRDD